MFLLQYSTHYSRHISKIGLLYVIGGINKHNQLELFTEKRRKFRVKVPIRTNATFDSPHYEAVR